VAIVRRSACCAGVETRRTHLCHARATTHPAAHSFVSDLRSDTPGAAHGRRRRPPHLAKRGPAGGIGHHAPLSSGDHPGIGGTISSAAGTTHSRPVDFRSRARVMAVQSLSPHAPLTTDPGKTGQLPRSRSPPRQRLWTSPPCAPLASIAGLSAFHPDPGLGSCMQTTMMEPAKRVH
jgi:hypothetical protein